VTFPTWRRSNYDNDDDDDDVFKLTRRFILNSVYCILAQQARKNRGALAQLTHGS
jgi:hypothetical protein